MDCIVWENDQAIVPVEDTTVKQRMHIAVHGFNIAMDAACDFPNPVSELALRRKA